MSGSTSRGHLIRQIVELTFTMSPMEGVAVKSALWASITTSITRGISTNCKHVAEEGGRNAIQFLVIYSSRDFTRFPFGMWLA